MKLDIAQFSTLKPLQLEAWLQLFESVPDARFYHHPHWLRCVSEHLTPDELSIAFVTVNDQLQLVVPLCNSKGKSRRAHPAHDHLSLNDILFRAELCEQPDELFSCLNAALCEFGNTWVDWHIPNVPNFSPLIETLAATNNAITENNENGPARFTSMHTKRHSDTDHWMLRKTRQSASFDCTSEDCPPHGKLRRNLRRLRKQMQEQAELRVERVVEPDQLSAAFEHFLLIEASGWKGEGREATAIAANPELVDFYAHLLKPSSRGVTPEINLLWSGEHCTAAQFGLRTGKCLSLLKIGYNEDFARFSPGYLLLESVLADAPGENIETLSLVTSPPWAERWHPDASPVWHINRYNNSTLGTAKHQLDKLKQIAKPLLKKAA